MLSLLITLIGEFEAEFKFYIGIYIYKNKRKNVNILIDTMMIKTLQ